jgi:AcrR family transcriptional regulator
VTEPPARQRLTAPERREQVVAVALKRFAQGGLHGTSTEDIAADAGLSQPYLFRLFRTKRDLFLACCEESTSRIGRAFREAAEAAPADEKLSAMGGAYADIVADESMLRFQLQMYAACADDVIRTHARQGFAGLINEVRALSGVEEDELWRFFASGMLINVVATLDLGEVDDDWVAQWADPDSELHAKP